MASLADLYEKAKNFITLQGTQPGELNFKDSLKVLAKKGKQDIQDKTYGFHFFDKPIVTNRGEAYDTGALNQMMQTSQNEAQQPLSAQYGPFPLSPEEIAQADREAVLGEMIGQIPQSIKDYTTGYRYSPGGKYGASRLNEENLGLLWESINEAYPDASQKAKETLLANIVAVAQAESGMGGAYGNPNAGNYRESNYWNWFKGGDRNFDPQSFEEMSDIITKGLGGYTMGNQGGRFSRQGASKYTGNDNLSYWYDSIYNPAMRAMGY